jgi:hypothetical protein
VRRVPQVAGVDPHRVRGDCSLDELELIDEAVRPHRLMAADQHITVAQVIRVAWNDIDD